MKLFLATGNKGKVSELIPLVNEFLPQFTQIIARAPKDAEETENTFLGNSKIKAEALASELIREKEKFPFAVLSDDSGLEVFALGNDPGVHSARYAGVHANAVLNVEKLLREMKELPKDKRSCRYVCSLYLLVVNADQSQNFYSSEGYCEGVIMQEAKGEGGFGYDPVFWSPALGKRMSEASLEDKNTHSHRRRAFEGLRSSRA